MPSNPVPRRPPPPPGSPPPAPEAPLSVSVPRADADLEPLARPKPLRTKWIVLGLISGVLGVSAGSLLWHPSHDHPHGYIDDGPRTRPPERLALLQEAKNRIRENDWLGAHERLLKLQGLEPTWEVAHDYLRAVEKEVPNQQHLTAARAALTEKKLALAHAELGLVSADTRQFEQVDQLRRELQTTADARVREARDLLEGQQLEQAQAIASDVLAAFPGHGDATLIQREAQRLLTEQQEAQHLADTRQDPIKDPWDQASLRFKGGDLSGALKLAQACAPQSVLCNAGLRDLTEFGELYRKLELLDIPGISRLMLLERAITGEQAPNVLGLSAYPRLADLLYKRALAEKAAGRWGNAVADAQRVLKIVPKHRGAPQILSEARMKAHQLFSGYPTGDTGDPKDMIPKLRELMTLLPPTDPLHQKAKAWLEKLER